MIKISVIIPVFKVAKYIRKCIDSVLNQTFQDFEIILVSDGPEEDDKICEEYVAKDSSISLIQGVNKGLGGARNAGIDLAEGNYIAFIDSDDWIEPNFLELMYNAIVSDSCIDVVQCGTEIVFEDEINKTLKENDEKYFAIKNEGTLELSNDLFGEINVGTWNKLYKKDLIIQYNLFFPEKMCNEDAYFTWAYWSVCRKIYFIPEKLYNYLRRDTSLMALTFSKGLEERVLDHYLIGEYFYDFLLANNLLTKRAEAFWKCFQVCWWFVKDNSNDEYKEIAQKVFYNFLLDKNVPEKYEDLIRIKNKQL